MTRSKNELCWADDVHDIYFETAEEWAQIQMDHIILPFLEEGNFRGTVLDLACGRGRWTHFIKNREEVEKVYAIDREAQNIALCRKRFEGDAKVEALVTDGYHLPVDAAVIDFIFCFDSMVHFDVDIVLSYLLETARVLKPGGKAFFHHSNNSQQIEVPIVAKPHLRNFMDHRLFALLAGYSGLNVVEQRVMDWGDESNLEVALDCLSLLQKPREDDCQIIEPIKKELDESTKI